MRLLLAGLAGVFFAVLCGTNPADAQSMQYTIAGKSGDIATRNDGQRCEILEIERATTLYGWWWARLEQLYPNVKAADRPKQWPAFFELVGKMNPGKDLNVLKKGDKLCLPVTTRDVEAQEKLDKVNAELGRANRRILELDGELRLARQLGQQVEPLTRERDQARSEVKDLQKTLRRKSIQLNTWAPVAIVFIIFFFVAIFVGLRRGR